jgi:quercetin dioxygenase-like cupin family protein
MRLAEPLDADDLAGERLVRPKARHIDAHPERIRPHRSIPGRSHMPRRLLVLLAVFAAGAAIGAYATASNRAATPPAVVREPLAAVNNPTGGKGRSLTLTKVVIPSHAQLALHYHPGTQIKKGSVTVMRGPADNLAKVVRKIGPGQTGTIAAGEWIVEQPTTEHSSANPTGKPTVIYLATLFPIGAPAAIPVK